jgi:hypothetical protein
MLLSERSKSEKAVCCMMPTILHFGKGKNYGDSKKMSGCQGLGGGRDEQKGYTRYLGQLNYCV